MSASPIYSYRVISAALPSYNLLRTWACVNCARTEMRACTHAHTHTHTHTHASVLWGCWGHAPLHPWQCVHPGRWEAKEFQQCVGIPMGTNCAPLVAELLLHDYESSAMIRFSRTNGHPQAKSFEFTRRYKNDLIRVNKPRFDKAIEKIYPSDLTLTDTTLADGKVAYLDRRIEIRDRQLVMSLYDKRDDFPFAIHNYPHLDSNVPCMPTYGVYISQLIRFAKACDTYPDFLTLHQRLVERFSKPNFGSIRRFRTMTGLEIENWIEKRGRTVRKFRSTRPRTESNFQFRLTSCRSQNLPTEVWLLLCQVFDSFSLVTSSSSHHASHLRGFPIS